MEGLRADKARLALRVLGARLRRDRDGLGVLLICIVLLGAACFFYFFAELVMATLFPVLFLAVGAAEPVRVLKKSRPEPPPHPSHS